MTEYIQIGETIISLSQAGEWMVWVSIIGALWVGLRATRP